MVDGFAMLVRLSPASFAASLARALRSSMVSPGLLIVGSNDFDFSNSFPISLIRPGFSAGAGGAGACCCAGDCTPGEGGGAACDQAAPGASSASARTGTATGLIR